MAHNKKIEQLKGKIQSIKDEDKKESILKDLKQKQKKSVKK